MTPATSPTDGREPWRGAAGRRVRWLQGDEGWEPRETAWRLASAVAIALAAVVLKALVVRVAQGELAYLSYIGAVVLAAWLAGYRGGLLATVICAISEVTIFGTGSGAPSPVSEPLGLGWFVVDGVMVTLIASGLRRATQREREARLRSDRLLEDQRLARAAAEKDRRALDALQKVTASLAGASTPAEVADAILDRGMTALGAVGGQVGRVEPISGTLELIAARGDPDPEVRPGFRLALDERTPLREAVTSGRAVYVGGAAEGSADPPAGPPGRPPDPASEGAIALLPLVAAGRVLGAAVFRFDHEVDFEDGLRDISLRLADQGAQALDRALAQDAERRARLILDREQDRLSFLALASDRLGTRPDIARSLSEVAGLAVPLLADWCAIDLSEPDRPLLAVVPGELGRILDPLRSPDPGIVGLRFAPGLTREGVGLLTAATGWSGLSADPRVAGALHETSTEEVLIALIAGADGAPVGSVVLGGVKAGRFDPADLPFIRDLAERIAGAAQRARLFAAMTRFKAMVDASGDAVFMFDPSSLRLTYVNRGAAELLAHERETLMGQSIGLLQPAFSNGEFERFLAAEVGGRGESVAYTSALVRGDGRKVPVEAILQEVTLADGTASVILTARDISERIDVQARLTRIAGDERRQAAELRAVLHAMGEGILVVGPDEVVSLANEAAMSIFGEDLPADLADLRRHLGSSFDADVAAGDGGERPDGDPRVLQLEDGRWLEVAAYPADLGPGIAEEGVSTIVVVRDVTRAKEAEAAREAFLGVLSHELRTPVAAIYGYSKVLQRPSSHGDPAEMLNDIEVESDRLYRIVEDLLVLSRVERGIAIDGEPLLVQHLIPPMIASEARRWPGIRFEVESPPDLPAVFGERTYVEQVLRNLISNAGKYSRAGSHVLVAAAATPTEVEIRVLDRGIGIATTESDRLFELFYRSPSSARNATGAGIGLYVARDLVRAMGGRIWARPRDGGGSEFGFSLPRCAEDAAAPSASEVGGPLDRPEPLR